MSHLLTTCLVYIKFAIEVFCALTNGGGVCSNDSWHVTRADRDSVESTWTTVVLLHQVTWLDVWNGPHYWTELNQGCGMAETSALTVLQLCHKAWRETQQQWEFKTVVVWVCVCVCPLSQHWTHRAVCMPEAAAVMNDYAGRPEDNVIFSQELDGNSSECLLHPEEHTQGTWSAVSLHLRHRTYTVCKKTLHMHTQPFQTCLIFVLSAFTVCNIFVILHNLNHSI